MAAAGVNTPAELGPQHFQRRVGGTGAIPFSELYERLAPGQLLSDPGQSGRFRAAWAMAQADSFSPLLSV